MDSTIKSSDDLKQPDQQTGLCDLPIEMLYKILGDCDVTTLLDCRLVSFILKFKI